MATQRNSNKSPETEEIRRKNELLQQELEIKNQRIEDLNFELRNLKKQQSIWEHLGKSMPKSQLEEENNRILQENNKLMRHLSHTIAESEQKDHMISELKQKISEIKYHNQQLKKISKKSQQVYIREIQILKSGNDSKSKNQTIVRLQEEKEKLENKMNKCAEIVKQTEQFYINELSVLNQQQEQQKEVIKRLQKQQKQQANIYDKLYEEYQRLKKENGNEKERERERNSGKWEDTGSIEEIISRQNTEKRWELALVQMKDRYQRQIGELKDNIKFLILKLQTVQDTNYQNKRNSFDKNSQIFGSSCSSLLTQSKIVMNPNNTNDSFRMTPTSSFSSSIKESLNRRQSGGSVRTPNKIKSSRCSQNHLGFLLDRTNI